jgi:hypothetical protein
MDQGAAAMGQQAPSINPNAFGADQYAQQYQQGMANFQNQYNSSQKDALGNLQSAAQGNTPSAAQLQMQQGIDSSINAQMAMANSTRLSGPAAAAQQRQAMDQGTQMQMQGVNQGAALRAQEMAQARGQYMQAAMGMGQEQMQAAGMAQPWAAQANQLATNQASMQQAQMSQNAAQAQGFYGLANSAYGQQLQGETGVAGMGVQQNVANNGANAQLVGAAAAAGSALLSDEDAKTGITPSYTTSSPSVGQRVDNGAANALGAFGSTLAGKKYTPKPIDGMNPQSSSSYGLGLLSDKEAKRDIQVSSFVDGVQHGIAQMQAPPPPDRVVGAALPQPARVAPVQLQGMPQGIAYTPAQAGVVAGNTGAAAAGAVPPPVALNPAQQRVLGVNALASDERIKSTMGPRGAPSVDRFLDPIRPVSFTYKADPEHRPQFGLLAQDLEKSPEGRTMVEDTPAGKVVDTRKAAVGGLAALAELHDRVARLESKVA